MDSEESRGIAQQLGQLQGQFKSFAEQGREEREGASKYRSDMRVAMGAVGESQRVMSDDMKELKEMLSDYPEVKAKVKSMEPKVSKMYDLSLQAAGVQAVGKYIWIGVVAIATVLTIIGGAVWTIVAELAKHAK